MSKRRAVTHADLAPSPPGTELGSKTGISLIVLTILCGLCCFILCLIAEATRSQVKIVAYLSHLCSMSMLTFMNRITEFICIIADDMGEQRE